MLSYTGQLKQAAPHPAIIISLFRVIVRPQKDYVLTTQNSLRFVTGDSRVAQNVYGHLPLGLVHPHFAWLHLPPKEHDPNLSFIL